MVDLYEVCELLEDEIVTIKNTIILHASNDVLLTVQHNRLLEIHKSLSDGIRLSETWQQTASLKWFILAVEDVLHATSHLLGQTTWD